MAHTLAEAQDEVATLVQQYRTNLTAYRAPGYKEAHARQHLIDPLLIALGWDVRNERGAAHTAHDRDLIQRQIDATDRQIDALVYQLYGLTEEEIKIVEGQ
jgi:type I site-specific restriction endonuclease